jgi:hypothetical protein
MNSLAGSIMGGGNFYVYSILFPTFSDVENWILSLADCDWLSMLWALCNCALLLYTKLSVLIEFRHIDT